jgi:anti-sigma regulatory factor (Ser/Thr protein kinase)
MSTSEKLCNSSQFARMDAVAEPQNAAIIRREFSDWLHEHFTLDATRACDVVLAVNEAMANAAEYAYARAECPGVMQVEAHYDETAATLTVKVTDHGAWREAEATNKQSRRGRGIPLMQALADRVTVDSSPRGTRVCLEWDHVSAVR